MLSHRERQERLRAGRRVCRDMCMSHVTHMNASYHPYECVMSVCVMSVSAVALLDLTLSLAVGTHCCNTSSMLLQHTSDVAATHIRCCCNKCQMLLQHTSDVAATHLLCCCNMHQMLLQHMSCVAATHIRCCCNTYLMLLQHTSDFAATHILYVAATHIRHCCNTPVMLLQHTSYVAATYIRYCCNTHHVWLQHTPDVAATHIRYCCNTHQVLSTIFDLCAVQRAPGGGNINTTHSDSFYAAPGNEPCYIKHPHDQARCGNGIYLRFIESGNFSIRYSLT